MSANPHNPPDDSTPPRTNLLLTIFRIAIAVTLLVIGIIVALSPTVVYAPVPRITLYLLISLLPAILLGAEAAARLELRLPGLVFTAAGATAIALTTLIVLTHYSKPEQQIAVFHIMDEKNQPVYNLDQEGAIEVPITDQGLTITKFIDGNTVVLIFPEQVGECTLIVKPTLSGPSYSGKVSYTGTRQSYLVLNRDLKKE